MNNIISVVLIFLSCILFGCKKEIEEPELDTKLENYVYAEFDGEKVLATKNTGRFKSNKEVVSSVFESSLNLYWDTLLSIRFSFYASRGDRSGKVHNGAFSVSFKKRNNSWQVNRVDMYGFFNSENQEIQYDWNYNPPTLIDSDFVHSEFQILQFDPNKNYAVVNVKGIVTNLSNQGKKTNTYLQFKVTKK